MSMSTNEGNVTRVTVELMITKVHRKNTGVYDNHLNTVTGSIHSVAQCTYVHI